MAFMVPQYSKGDFAVTDHDDDPIVEWEYHDDPAVGLQGTPERVNGWFCRLSAPGYLDCTPWHGPHDTLSKAIQDMAGSYEDLDPLTGEEMDEDDPFNDHIEAIADAIERLYHHTGTLPSGVHERDLLIEIGNCNAEGTVTVYTYDRQGAIDDQSIDGSMWEAPNDMSVAYACLSMRSDLLEDLRSEGYVIANPEHNPGNGFDPESDRSDWEDLSFEKLCLMREIEASRPEWIDEWVTDEASNIKAICQGGCASGAYMPAVTYCTASDVMARHGDTVLDYIDNHSEPLTVPAGESWSGIAVMFLSHAVELWCLQWDDRLDWDQWTTVSNANASA
jgi:hypothetical protein